MKRMLLVILFMAVGATFPSPLFPLYQESYHLSSLQLTMLFAVYAAFALPVLLVTGSKGSRWGLKNVLRASLWISLASTILFMSSAHTSMLYIARALEGIAYGAFTGTASAFLLRKTPADKWKSSVALSGMAVSMGLGLGSAICGLTIQYLRWVPQRTPFAILAVILVAALILLESVPGGERERTGRQAAPISLGVPQAIRHHFWSFMALPIFLVFTLNGIVLSLIPSYVKNVIHSSNLSISGLLILLLLGGGALSPLIPWVKSPVHRMRLGVVLLAAGAWMIVLAGNASNLAMLWAGIFLQTIGNGWTFQVSLRLAGELPEPGERPKVITTYYLAGYWGFIVPIVGVGALTSFFSLHTALVLLNALAACLVLYVLLYSFRFSRFYGLRNEPAAEDRTGRIALKRMAE